MNTTRSLTLLLLVAYAACSSPTAPAQHQPPPPPPPDTTPKKVDPTVLVRNNRPDLAYFYWKSGDTALSSDVIPGNTTRCEAFTAVADSAFWEIATDTTEAGWALFSSPAYFDPSTRPAWTVDIMGTGLNNPTIVMKDTTAECTP